MDKPTTPHPFKAGKFFAILLLPPLLACMGGFIDPFIPTIIGIIGSLTGIYCGRMLFEWMKSAAVLKLSYSMRVTLALVCCTTFFILNVMLNLAGCASGFMFGHK